MDLPSALTITKSLLSISNTDSDIELSSLLESSKGMDSDGNYQYRPYIVAASYIPFRYAITNKGIIEADGVKWLKPDEWLSVARSLLNLQKAADCNLEIESCWTVESILDQLNCNNECRHEFSAMLI